MPSHSARPAEQSFAASVVVLNWNGGTLVEECVASVLKQDIGPLEIVVVDNGSTDGSVSRIRLTAPQVKIIELGTNHGYSAGMNTGIDATGGEFVMLLNLDVTVDPAYLRLCVQRLVADPALGGVTGKLLKPGRDSPAVIDTSGHVVYRSRRAVDRGEGERDAGQFDCKTELFGVGGAAPVYRRAMLDEIRLDGHYFDEDFFAYFEDFDLSWRARLKGWRFALVPEARGHHHRGATGGKSSTRILAFNHVNRLFVIVKNDHPLSVLRHLPDILYTELRATLHMLGKRPAALIKAWAMFFGELPVFLAKRKQIQASRKVDWRELEPWFEPYRYGIRATLQRARKRRSGSAERLAR